MNKRGNIVPGLGLVIVIVSIVLAVALVVFAARDSRRIKAMAVGIMTNDVPVAVTQPDTNILWTAGHPMLVMRGDSGLVQIPATGCELGLRADGVVTWRLVEPYKAPTNAAPKAITPKKRKSWFGWN